MWKKLVDLWNYAWREPEDWEYFKYLRKNHLIGESKTKTEMYKEILELRKEREAYRTILKNLEKKIKFYE